MDFLSHGLWGGIVFGRKNKRTFWWAFFIGLAPDLFSFGPFFLVSFLGLTGRSPFSGGPPDPALIPSYVHQLYNPTHSLIVFGATFLVLWAILKKPFWPLLAWGLHIVFDIFTHSFEFFPTSFLWPISDFKIDAWSWGNPWIYLPNVFLLALLYLWFFVIKRRGASASKPHQ